MPTPAPRLEITLQHLQLLPADRTRFALCAQPDFPGSVVDEFSKAVDVFGIAGLCGSVSLGGGKGGLG